MSIFYETLDSMKISIHHFVFVTKYRYKVLKGDIGLKVRKLIRQTYEAFEIEILKGVVSQDHVHILLSAPHNMAPSEIMRRIKRRSSAKLFESFPDLKKRYWGRHFWARGYFCVTSGETDRRNDSKLFRSTF